MKNRFLELLRSRQIMAVINLLFFFAVLIPNQGIIFAAHTLWIVFLIYSIKHAQSNSQKIVYGIVTLIPVALIAVNLYFMMNHTG